MTIYYYIEEQKDDEGNPIYFAEAHLTEYDEEIGQDTIGIAGKYLPHDLCKQLQPILDEVKQLAIMDSKDLLPQGSSKLVSEVFA